MKWPCVSRLAFDLITAERDRALKRVDALEAHLDTVTAKLVQATEPAPKPTIPVREPDPIGEAIRTKAGANGALRAHLATWAKEQRLLGEEEQAVVMKILDWTQHQTDEIPW